MPILYKMKFFCFLLFFLPLLAEAKEKICLNMIVKDESRVIRRCLDSVKPIIDYWVIIDTGSTDGTQDIIKEHMKDIPGMLYERPWKNFGDNRTEALDLAQGKGDYILFMDADDIMVYEEGFELFPLTQDYYAIWQGSEWFSFQKTQLVRSGLPWKWVGVTHEYLDCIVPYTSGLLQKVKYVLGDDGARSRDPKKFLKNAQLLEEELKKDPNNSRYVFYLAESYKDAGEKAKALEWYQKRVDMKGWDEEIFWSLFQIANMLREIGLAPSVVAEAYIEAHLFRPHRAEPLYHLVDLYIWWNLYDKGYECLKKGDSISKPLQKDALFSIDWIEDYGILFQRSVCAFHIGNYQEALDICDRLIAMKNLPDVWREQAITNRTIALEKLAN